MEKLNDATAINIISELSEKIRNLNKTEKPITEIEENNYYYQLFSLGVTLEFLKENLTGLSLSKENKLVQDYIEFIESQITSDKFRISLIRKRTNQFNKTLTPLGICLFKPIEKTVSSLIPSNNGISKGSFSKESSAPIAVILCILLVYLANIIHSSIMVKRSTSVENNLKKIDKLLK